MVANTQTSTVRGVPPRLNPAVTPLPRAASDAAPLRLILVEDDEGDALLVRALLEETQLVTSLSWSRSLTEALDTVSDSVRCVLLDLALPDAAGLEALHAVLRAAPQAAVLVLTGYADEHLGIQAVAAGAQDYLVKGEVTGELLARAVRFAIERKRAEESARQLREAEHFAQENARLERGLLPQPLLADSGLDCLVRYRAGRSGALLGGDFYDVIEGPDGRVFALVGDVSGHSPDSAALGVYLRIAWRTLVLAGTDSELILPTLNEIVERERRSEGFFATVCMIVIAPDRASVKMFLAGHPAPLGFCPSGTVTRLPESHHGPVLGLLPHATWRSAHIEMPAQWSLLLFTDGIFEGRVGAGPERLGEDGLAQLVRDLRPTQHVADSWPDELINTVEELNGGGLADDVAIVLLSQLADLSGRTRAPKFRWEQPESDRGHA